jgi:hypothetical protein
MMVGVLSLAGTGRTATGRGAESYMAEALAEMMAGVRYLTDNTALGYDGGGVCLVGVHLPPGDSYDLDRPFQAGVRYVLIAGGDHDAQDVDLEILDNGRPVVAAASTRLASLEFTPPRSGYYRIRLRLCAAFRDSFCAFAVMRRNGYDVPVGNLTAAGDQFLDMCRAVADRAGASGLRAGFLREPNQAAVWGIVLQGGQSRRISNINLGDNVTIGLAAGDTQATDLDLYLEDNPGNVLAQDTEPDATPFVEHQPDGRGLYALRVKNADRDGPPTFALFGLVQVQD